MTTRAATTTPARVVAAARGARDLAELEARMVGCRACPRLVAWRDQVGAAPRAAYRDQRYWSRPVPGFGDEQARILLVGLAPGAHGANRTGRMFTGDRSGDVLVAALHRAGLADRPTSTARDDGLRLLDARMTAPVRCAPPGNQPTPDERHTCGPWLARELELVAPRVVVALGAIGWAAVAATLVEQGWSLPRPRPAFGHGVQLVAGRGHDRLVVLAGYHVSQQNTFTGRLTPAILDEVLARARSLATEPPPPPLRTVAQVRAYADDLGELGYPFGPGTGVHKIAGRMFLLSPDHGGTVSLKCDPHWAAALRRAHPAIAPAWHLNKQHWIGVDLTTGFAVDGGTLTDALVADLVDRSYELVVAGLTRAARAELRRRPAAGATPRQP